MPANPTDAERDQAVLKHLISTYGADLGLAGHSPDKQADILHRLSEQAGQKVAKGSIVAILRGTTHKGHRHIDTYEGITLTFAALDARLMRDDWERQNCFVTPLAELQELAATYQRPVRGSKTLEEGLARIRNFKAARASTMPVTAQEDRSQPQQAVSGSYAPFIFGNWLKPEHRGPQNITPGFYQIFRVYKPTRELSNIKALAGPRKQSESAQDQGSSIGNYGGADLQDHVVVCELVWVDADSMECNLVTSERNTYVGTLHINHEDILFALLQRKTGSGQEINHRFICAKVVRVDLAYHSGLMIKVGDTTGRPVASECLFVRIRKRLPEHRDLYQEIEILRAVAANGTRVPKDSVIARYVTPTPPAYSSYDPAAPEWKDIKFVRDFPALFNLSKIQGNSPNKFRLLREPSRTLAQDVLTILGREKEMALPPYRRQDA
jgi:hypothetical protein